MCKGNKTGTKEIKNSDLLAKGDGKYKIIFLNLSEKTFHFYKAESKYFFLVSSKCSVCFGCPKGFTLNSMFFLIYILISAVKNAF